MRYLKVLIELAKLASNYVDCEDCPTWMRDECPYLKNHNLPYLCDLAIDEAEGTLRHNLRLGNRVLEWLNAHATSIVGREGSERTPILVWDAADGTTIEDMVLGHWAHEPSRKTDNPFLGKTPDGKPFVRISKDEGIWL